VADVLRQRVAGVTEVAEFFIMSSGMILCEHSDGWWRDAPEGKPHKKEFRAAYGLPMSYPLRVRDSKILEGRLVDVPDEAPQAEVQEPEPVCEGPAPTCESEPELTESES
jgi:hypothetical protein